MGRSMFAGRLSVALALLLLVMLVPSASADDLPVCPNRQSPGFRGYLPECRAYELVSPPYKESLSLTLFGTGVKGMAEDGEQLLIETLGSLSGTEGVGLLGTSYRVGRTGLGWETTPLVAPLSAFPEYKIVALSPDLDDSLWFSNVPGQTKRDVYFAAGSGSLTRVGPGAPPGFPVTTLSFEGASKDLLRTVFTVRSSQSNEGQRLWPGDTTTGEALPSLYEYVGTGNTEPELVGISDEHRVKEIKTGHPHLISNCGTVFGSPEGRVDDYNAISETGGSVFFMAMACGSSPAVNELYARIDEEKTVAISEPSHPLGQGSGPGPEECNPACEAAEHKPGYFAGASADGSKVFLLTAQPLLNSDTDATTDLYEAEIEGEGASARIGKFVQVSRDPNVGQAAEVQGVARVSENGSHVYFVARGVLTTEPDLSLRAGHQIAVEGEDNLYMYERDARYPNGHTAFVATLRAADREAWQATDVRPVQATPDGRFVVFQSTADLTPDQEGRENDATQVFEYDAEGKTLVRASQGQNGYNEDGNTSEYPATIPVQEYLTELKPTERFSGLAVSADGSDVVFSSEDALTPLTSTGINNVYEYHDGLVALISDGHDAVRLARRPATELIGTDESGRDVFFTTADSLVPQDTDTQVDVYDARIDGGFASPTTPLPCSGDPCQNPPDVAPSLLVPGVASSTAEPPPTNSALNARAKAQVKKKPKKLKRRAKKKKGKKRKIAKRRSRS
jgi:hypothetical protein